MTAEELVERLLGLDARQENALQDAKTLRWELHQSLVATDDLKTFALRLKHGATCVRFNGHTFPGAEELARELVDIADALITIAARWEASEEAAKRLTRPVPRGSGWFTAE